MPPNDGLFDGKRDGLTLGENEIEGLIDGLTLWLPLVDATLPIDFPDGETIPKREGEPFPFGDSYSLIFTLDATSGLALKYAFS